LPQHCISTPSCRSCSFCADCNADTGWSHPAYDKLILAARNAGTNPERFAVYQQMEKILAEELPVIPVDFYTRVFAVNPKLRLVPNVIDNRNWKFVEFLP
jgi:oligopeptide transport system substrate-binding protein